ncbi:MAG: hypothetical protein BWX70_03293 [Verrucomicrobia bacterium ADurb.Bin070]|nr:MAG: hypothetical protein BWX70_03293 [Verrucomicrobia bacterium ADurb.Bin070]
MQAALNTPLPIFGGDQVSERIEEIVAHHLGHAGGTGGEVEQHDVAGTGLTRAVCLVQRVGCRRHAGIEIQPVPAGAARPHYGAQADLDLCGRLIHRLAQRGLVHRDDRLHTGGLDPVRHILLHELRRRGNGDRAQPAEPQQREPELVAPPQHQHHGVALADPHRLKNMGGAHAFARDLGHREDPLAPLVVAPHQRTTVRVCCRDLVNHIERKIEAFRHVHRERAAKFLLRGEGVLVEPTARHRSLLCR